MNRQFIFTTLVALFSAIAPIGAQNSVELARNADPNFWESWFDAGVEQLNRRPALALQAFQHASKLDPSRAEPLMAQYVAFWMSISWEDWVAWWFDEDPIMSRRPDVVGADSLFSLSLKRNPFVHRGLEIALVERRAQGNYSRRADTRAWIAYSAGRFDESVRIYEDWLKRDKASKLRDVWDLAVARVGANDLNGAITDLQYLVDAMNQQDDTSGTVRYYRSKEAFLYAMGLIHMQRRDLASARLAFGEAIVENAGFAYAHAALAQVDRAERKMPAAMAAMAQAVELAPGDPVLRNQYAQVLLDAGRYDGAVTEAQRVVQAEPQWAAPLYIIARARERQGRTAQATEAYRSYVSRAPRADPQARAIRERLGIAEP